MGFPTLLIVCCCAYPLALANVRQRRHAYAYAVPYPAGVAPFVGQVMPTETMPYWVDMPERVVYVSAMPSPPLAISSPPFTPTLTPPCLPSSLPLAPPCLLMPPPPLSPIPPPPPPLIVPPFYNAMSGHSVLIYNVQNWVK